MVDLSAKHVDTAKLLDQPGLEGGPVIDFGERSSLVQWDGLEHQHYLGRIVTFGQSESVQSQGQPIVEIIGMATPVVSDKFGRLETGRGWLGVEKTVGRRRGSGVE